ncbi:LuxR C-terminal-related transcriptional regulator [Actinoplanes sp. NPDC023714]|uniref:LuxR C-terminal-related transcriptional regulator n=1 Tax=Actinoplanes sp. NPDC023714 TaxID=3154322 RepID=UPI0033FD2751
MADEPELAARTVLRQGPALVVLTGPPGCGRTTLLRRIAAAVPGPAHLGGGLAMLSAVPALALSRAVRARLPGDDVHLLAEAVRSRVRGGLLVIDDLQHADAATLAALPHLARSCRVLVALRTPNRLALDELRAAATAWLPIPPLAASAAAGLARSTAGGLDDAAVAAVLARAGGNPLAIIALARQAAAGRAPVGEDIDQIAYAVAAALADLPRPARTALAALGLLGRPARAELLGTGAADLLAAGLVTAEPGGSLLPVSGYVAETAAGLLDAAARADLHARLAELTPPAESARHLAAAGDTAGAYRRALAAADRATGGERAALLLFACALDVPADPRVRLAAADAALAAGRPLDAAAVLRPLAPVPPTATTLALEAAVLRGEALLQAGDPAAAREAVRPVPDTAGPPVVAARDRVLLLATLTLEPMAALDLADKIAVRHPHPLPGIAAALAAVQATHRLPGWEESLSEAAFGPAADPLITRWSAWLLVEHLAADGRLLESAQAATRAAAPAGEALAYGWQTRFLAAADWALALHGHELGLAPTTPAPASERPDPGGADFGALVATGPAAAVTPTPIADPGSAEVLSFLDSASRGRAGNEPASDEPAGDAASPVMDEPAWDGAEGVLRRAANLTDRAVPTEALAYATAATALIEADTGLLAAARARLARAGLEPAHPNRAARPDTPPADALGAGASHEGRRTAATGTFAGLDAHRPATGAVAGLEPDRPPAGAGLGSDRPAIGDAASGRPGSAPSGVALHPAAAWVAREVAWLDGQPDRAVQAPAHAPTAHAPAGLLAGLHAITGQWAAHDLGVPGSTEIPVGLPGPARRTLTAWVLGNGFAAAADGWRPVALREQIRCLLAAGLTENDRDRAVAALLQAEQLADRAGLTVLAGRARRGLRRHQIHRDTRSPRSHGRLTQRELDVLRLVADGEPTRRIAGQLGISAETVDTHIRASMRKLGARTRTEAAALAFAAPGARTEPFETSEDGR